MTRVHCAAVLETGREIALPESASQHVVKVLRLRAGDSLLLFDGRGNEHDAEIVSIAQGRVSARVLDRRAGVGVWVSQRATMAMLPNCGSIADSSPQGTDHLRLCDNDPNT